MFVCYVFRSFVNSFVLSSGPLFIRLISLCRSFVWFLCRSFVWFLSIVHSFDLSLYLSFVWFLSLSFIRLISLSIVHSFDLSLLFVCTISLLIVLFLSLLFNRSISLSIILSFYLSYYLWLNILFYSNVMDLEPLSHETSVGFYELCIHRILCIYSLCLFYKDISKNYIRYWLHL